MLNPWPDFPGAAYCTTKAAAGRSKQDLPRFLNPTPEFLFLHPKCASYCRRSSSCTRPTTPLV